MEMTEYGNSYSGSVLKELGMSLNTSRRRSNRLQFILLALLVAGSGVFYLASVSAVFNSLAHHAGRARPPFNFSEDPRWAVKPLPEAREAGIEPPDVIVDVNGVPFSGMAELIDQVYHARAGEKLSVTFRSPSGIRHTVHVSLLPRLPHVPHASRWILAVLIVAIFPAFCLILGFWVVIAKPRDWNAWFFMGVMTAVPVFFGLWGYYPGWLTPFTIYWQIFARRVMFIALILLGIYFPVRSRLDRRRPWLKWVVIVPQIAMIPYTILLAHGLLYRAELLRPYLLAAVPLHLADNILEAIALVIFLAAVVRKLFTVRQPDARRRLRVVAAGSFFGLTPMLVVLLISTFSGISVNEVAPSWLIVTLVLLFGLFPLSLAYTVLVQRAFDIRIFLRQGTRYALAKGTLWGLQAVVLIYLGYRLIHFTHESGHHLMRLTVPVIFVVAVFFLRLRVAQPLSRWLDRRFFRDEYSAELVLSELSEQAREFTEIEPLIRTVFQRLSQTLHIEKLAVFLRREADFHLEYSQGLPEVGEVSLARNSALLASLSSNSGQASVYREQPDGWLAHANSEEREALKTLNADLVLPLPGRSSLIGILSLGPKLSEEPYSPVDRRLLQSVALQTGLSIENSHLIHTLAEEAANRDRMNREMEIAQEVQARLFPQSYPGIEGVDMAGLCRTAQRIGGDYYDFFLLENRRLGVAIGDVSGKGISAALLMASIRAALRGLTLAGTPEPAEVMRRLNRILSESSASNRFITFFFGEYDPALGRLDYVNAGHDPPILLRASGCGDDASEGVERLTSGGPVMGLFPESPYQQGRVHLKPCDVLIAFTDGLSEAMKGDFEEWGEQRLIEAAKKYVHLSAREIAAGVVRDAEEFTAGAPQNDDLTMVVLKA